MTQPLKPLNLLTIKLKDKSFHNSVKWSGRYLQVKVLHGWEKVSDLQFSDYRKIYIEQKNLVETQIYIFVIHIFQIYVKDNFLTRYCHNCTFLERRSFDQCNEFQFSLSL